MIEFEPRIKKAIKIPDDIMVYLFGKSDMPVISHGALYVSDSYFDNYKKRFSAQESTEDILADINREHLLFDVRTALKDVDGKGRHVGSRKSNYPVNNPSKKKIEKAVESLHYYNIR